MKTCLALMLATLSAVAVSPALAGSQTGFVKDIYVRDSDGLVLVDLTGTASLHPACATQPYWILPNENTDTGKRLFSMLLEAQASGRVVSIIGKDTCSRWVDGEDIETVGINGTATP